MDRTSEIKIGEKLAELLAVSDKTYEEVANEIGASTSAITQYRKGNTRPSLDKLVLLSKVFDVSLDYLVFGKEHEREEINVDPIIRSMDHSLQDMQIRTAQHSSLFARVGRHLSKRIDNEIERYLSEESPYHHPGIISISEMHSLEQHSQKTRLALRNFEYNLASSPSKTPGRFFATVANNLSQGREYQYLLAENAPVDWSATIREFRDLLWEHTRNKDVVQRNCRFRVTDAPLTVSFGLCELVEDDFREDDAILYDFLAEQEYVDESGRIGYVAPPSRTGRADAIMGSEHLSTSYEIFEILWEEAEEI